MSDYRSKVDKLSELLNSRTGYHGPRDEHTPISEAETPGVESHWNPQNIDQMLAVDPHAGEKRSLWHFVLSKIFILAIVFFLVAAGVAAYIFFGGGNFISSKNVDITVRAPETVSAGDTLSLDITVTNKNNADLELANLSISYPDGTHDAVDSGQVLTFAKENLGTVTSGQEVTKSEKAIFFGELGEVKEIKLSLEYRVKGSSAVFNKEKLVDVTIGNVPVSMKVAEPKSVTSGEPFETTITLTSNSTEVLRGVVLRGEYPYGFVPQSTTPSATGDGQNLWTLGDLSPGDKKVISVRGTLTGQDLEQRTFRFSAGVSEASNPTRFATSLATDAETVTINRPDIGLELALNGDASPSYVAPATRPVTATIRVTNNLTDKILHARVVAKLSGSALDRFSVSAGDGGFYDSANNQVIWDEASDPRLAVLASGDAVEYSLQFSSLAPTSSTNNKNQEIDLNVTAAGSPVGAQALSVNDSRVVKIASTVTFTANSLYSKGAFKNSGPIPPRAEKATTYTIVLDLKNTQNDITNPQVTMNLGSNVIFVGTKTVAGENLNYNDNNKSVTWSFDTLPSGTGFSSPTREVAFQVSLSPSIGQIGSVPVLVNNINFTGKDSFTGASVNLTLPQVTTRTDTDPTFVQGNEVVTK